MVNSSTPQFNTSVPHKDHTFSARETPQFNTKTPQFNTKISHFHTKNPQFNTKNGPFGVELMGFRCGTETCVELRTVLN